MRKKWNFGVGIVLAATVLILLASAVCWGDSFVFTGNAPADFMVGGNLKPGCMYHPDDVDAFDRPESVYSPECSDPPLDRISFDKGWSLKYSWPGGFNIQSVYWYYDIVNKCLYVGLDVADCSHGYYENIGTFPDPKIGPRHLGVRPVPWDMDGDGNRNTVNTSGYYDTGSAPTPNDYFKLSDFNQETKPKFYEITIDLNQDGTTGNAGDLDVLLLSSNNAKPSATATIVGDQSNSTSSDNPSVDTSSSYFWNGDPQAVYDIELKINIPKGLPVGSVLMQTSSGSTTPAAEDQTSQEIMVPCLSVKKEVRCVGDTEWHHQVAVMKGQQVEFRVTVENCSPADGEALTNVTVVDSFQTLTDSAGRKSTNDTIPSPIYFGTVAPSESKSQSYIVTANASYMRTTSTDDIINIVTATGTGELTRQAVTADNPISERTATIDVIVPALTCDKKISGERQTTPLPYIDLTDDHMADDEALTYCLTVTNNGECDIDLTQGPCNPPGVHDSLLESDQTPILTPTAQNVAVQFPSILHKGESVTKPFQVMLHELKINPGWLDSNNEKSNIMRACGLATQSGICGTLGVNCNSTAKFKAQPPATIDIKKEVSCDSANGFDGVQRVEAIRGSTVYFKVTVTNTGTWDLKNVSITDVFSDPYDVTPDTIPPTPIIVGNLVPGQSWTHIYPIHIRSEYGQNPDGTIDPAKQHVGDELTNTITGSGVGPSGETVTDTSSANNAAKVDVLIPWLSVEKLVSSDDNPSNKLHNLDLSKNGAARLEKVHYWLTLENKGETNIRFVSIGDTLLDSDNRPTITPYLANKVISLFPTTLTPGQKVTADLDGSGPDTGIGMTFDETKAAQRLWPNKVSVAGVAEKSGACGSENVTGTDGALVTINPLVGLTLTKDVACATDTAYSAHVDAMRGSTVNFRVTAKNVGNVPLTTVITDVFSNHYDVTPDTIPSPIYSGTLQPGEVWSKIYPIHIRSDYAKNSDGTPYPDRVGVVDELVNTATGSATTSWGDVVQTGPQVAKADVVLPWLKVEKLVSSDETPANMLHTLDLRGDGVPDDEKVHYWLTLENKGDTDIRFTSITDSLLDKDNRPTITPSPTLVRPMFPDVLAKGQKVTADLDGSGPDTGIGVTFHELVATKTSWPNQLTVTGVSEIAGACGTETVTGTDSALVLIRSLASIDGSKEVSCDPVSGFTGSHRVEAIRGSKVYFKITITNNGNVPLTDVVITDTLTIKDHAATPGIPVTIRPNITYPWAPGSSWSTVYAVQTSPTYADIGVADEIVNSIGVTAKDPSGETVGYANTDPDAISVVDVLVPALRAVKEISSDDNPAWTHLLDIWDGKYDEENLHYRLTLTNTGETDIDFSRGGGIHDSLLDQTLSWLTPTTHNVSGMFNSLMKPGESKTVTVDAVCDEKKLKSSLVTNVFSAEGLGVKDGACGSQLVPASDSASFETHIDTTTVFQVYPGNSKGKDKYWSGYRGTFGDTITASPGVFEIIPGTKWVNFIKAARDQWSGGWTLKNVILRKNTPSFIQCSEVYAPKIVIQQGTAGIRTWWPLMYEAPGTVFTLTILYGTGQVRVGPNPNDVQNYDDDGTGPNPPGPVHTETWQWAVDADLDSLKLLLDLFHQMPFGLDEVPLISDEVLYPVLKDKITTVQSLYQSGDVAGAGLLLGDFELEVSDACISSSPVLPYPTANGTGIAQTDENPACCKILVDVEHIAKKLGIFVGRKN